VKVWSEREYYIGKLRKDTVDWMVEDEDGLLFVECKTKRLRLEAKSEIRTEAALEGELDKLAGFISQIYRTIKDFKAGAYPGIPHHEGKRLFPIVITLEEWYVFGPRILGSLEERVRRRLVGDGLPAQWTTEMPYSVSSADEFERLIQIVVARGIAVVMGRKASDPELRRWQMHAFMYKECRKEFEATRDLFPEVLDEIAPVGQSD